MQSLVTRYSNYTNLAVSEFQGNKIGTVAGTCKTVKVDPTKKDYFSKITIEYDTTMVKRIEVSAASGNSFTYGKSPTSPLTKVLTFTLDRQLGGFFGKEGSRINSLGAVTIDASCLVGVDSTLIKEPIIPLPSSETTANTKSNPTTNAGPKTCLLKTKVLYGNQAQTPAYTPYDDFTYLSQREDSDSYFRLTTLKLCTNQENGLLYGLQAGVTKYSSTTNLAIDSSFLTKIGTVQGNC